LPYVKHKNGLLNDNRVSNIEWTANKPIININSINNINSYPKIKHYVKYTICKNNQSKKQLYFKTEKEALERIKTIQLINPEYKSTVQKKIYYLTEITYNEKKFYKKHQDYLLVHRLHRQMYLVIKYCNLFLKLLKKNK
jgi:ribosomal protein L11 methylase PrmA